MWLNPLVLKLIGSPAHHAMSKDLTRIAYTGPVSGREARLPVQSVADGSGLLVVVGRHEQKRWWRAVRAALTAAIVRAGVRYEALGEVLAGTERAEGLAVYLAAHPGRGRGIGPSTPVIAFTRVGSC